MYRHVARVIVWAVVAAVPVGAIQAQGSPRRCPKLLGTAETRVRNKAYRERNLLWTSREASGITVVHSNPRWEKVPLLSFGGLTLEARAGRGTVVVRLSNKLARKLGCQPGRYRIRRDDSIGRGTRALALLGDYVLVAHGGQLGFLAPPEAKRPRWLLAWTLRGATIRPPRGGQPQARRPPPKRPPPKRPPPKRPPRHEARKPRRR